MKAKNNEVYSDTPVYRDKKALPLFDVCFPTTHTNKRKSDERQGGESYF